MMANERCAVCEGMDQPGQVHNPRAPYCTEAVKVRERYAPESIYRAWEKQPQFLLCRDTGRKATKKGICPKHGGDACLFVYVQVSALVRDFESKFRAVLAE